ncbi:MAG: TIGR03790 family protein [endosymbiont of Galathealinum brachiosum]|uniref:TIGR03790 family protein n=1 Tax=endosymbiont of Galathealinum brachiosum TaxID=2200906 RepID=A0A370D7W8_9GAMM|nr:MAG: TIGR03790 family protein [endosymbiont of Galathealinum brachiosum]
MDTKVIFKYKILLTVIAILVITSVKAEINNQTLAVLVNQNDPESLEIAKHYQKTRLIPDGNIIYLSFSAKLSSLSEAEFKEIEMQLKDRVPENIQAYVLAWRKPWRADCMSMTSALSLGFSKDYCAKGCKLSKPVKYFNSHSKQPYMDYKIRPSMMLSAGTVEGVKQLIDRGELADYSRPVASAYLLSTSDKQRNVRAVYYPHIKKTLGDVLNVEVIKADAIKNANDVMFYFTGQEKVKWVNKNKYLPGAVADHLTSTGGHLFNGKQMSVIEWIDAGVTGTYGTVVEPCNFAQKFPNPVILMQRYMSGETLLEAYWKSVQMPGQGLFVGEPLASPYKDCKLHINRKGVVRFLKNEIDNYVSRESRNCN